jgi:hypothetical protein
MKGKVKFINVDGTYEIIDRSMTIGEICKKLDAKCLDTVNLKDGHVMLVDDWGMIDDLPINKTATEMYRKVRLGSPNFIHGKVAIVWDEDFGCPIVQ